MMVHVLGLKKKEVEALVKDEMKYKTNGNVEML